MNAYVFAVDATGGALTSALALVSGGTARRVLPTTGDRELYVAVADSDATNLVNKIATVSAISGLTTVTVYLAYGETSVNAVHPTYAASINTQLGFMLLTTSPADTVSVWEDSYTVSGVVGAAMVAGTETVLVEATASTTGALTTILDNVAAITGADEVARAQGPVSGGAGF